MFSKEFDGNRVLQWSLGALLFCYFVTFSSWVGRSNITIEAVETFRHVCPPYFQSCEALYFLRSLPEGYSQTFLYMLFFGVLVWCVYLLSEKRWFEVQLSLVPIFIWHLLNVLVLTDLQNGNYEYYVIVFGLILLFFPHKEFFLKLALVLFYTLSTVAKIHPSWIEGSYFNALQDGLPLFPDTMIPLFTNLVILMEMVGAWFLFSNVRWLQRVVLVFFVMFHLYSGILVEYHYPAIVLPMLLILFGPWHRDVGVPIDTKSLVGWVFILLLISSQFIPRLIPGDEKLTLEGNKYGLYMFEANHQCISATTLHRTDGTTETVRKESTSARNRCNPYSYWFHLNQMCERVPDLARIQWTFDHSINGGPFYRIVDVPDACELDYQAFERNMWIKTEQDKPEMIGWPVKNLYY